MDTMIITIGGQAGSGKSTAAELLAKKLGYKRFSGGDFRRQLAKELGMTLQELNKLGETNFMTDAEVDKKIAELGKSEDNVVIDGRTAWYFIPNSFKVYLVADLETRARRVFRDERLAESFKTLKETRRALIKREGSDRKRYRKYYNIDVNDRHNYDIVIDTSKIDPKAVVERITRAMEAR